ncbi:MAG: hypothetical protein OHK0013_40660 [Sandaracinaceae bacterium]
MKRAPFRPGLVVLAALLASLVTERAQASIVDAMSLAELVREADVIIVARVDGQRARWDHQGRIVTDVTLRVTESLHGGLARGAVVVARRLGGELGDLGLRVEGEARYVDGESVLLFARRLTTPAGVVLRPVGMSQGVLPIDDTGGVEVVMPGGAGLELVTRSPDGRLGPGSPALAGPEPADALLDRVRALVAELHGSR